MNYQQGSQRIEVIVRKGSAVGIGDKGKLDVENISSTQNGEGESGGTRYGNVSSKRFWQIQGTHTLAVGKQITQQSINFYVNNLGLRTGDSNLQDLVSRQIEQVKDPVNILSSAAIGATYGASAGPIGMVFGAILNSLSTATGITFKYLQRGTEYQYEVFKQNNNIEYNRARAGINLTNGRLR